eukprot:TRINITY_DN120094_c2_g1_i1.p1 TRINITY_DN120094_c2_g1~~TRINITY_DN120094_c2_g1_i1.p1  ORF type:complete len:864 (-),score=58.85 TRINITY_DN120094_c2_g1_i1:3639-6230(-)
METSLRSLASYFSTWTKLFLDAFVLYIKNYPIIKDKSDLCTYYRKMNASFPRLYTVLVIPFVVAQIVCILVFPFYLELRKILPKMVTISFIWDVAFIGPICYFSKVIEQANTKENKWKLCCHRSLYTKIQAFIILPTLISMLSPFIIPYMGNHADLATVIWMYFYITQLHLCTWIADGVFYKNFLMILSNTTFCGICMYKGYFNMYNSPKFTVPPILSAIFFVMFDKYVKENFILKRALKGQKRMYEAHLKNSKDPTIIIEEPKVVFCNEAAKETVGETLDQFYTKALHITSEKGEPLSDHVRKRFIEDKPASQIVHQEKYLLRTAPADTKHFHVTLIESKVFARKKILSLALHELTNDLLEEKTRIESKYKNMLFFSLSHELRTPLNIFQAFLSCCKSYMQTPELFELYKNARGAWRYLKNKISDILDYAQILSNEFVLHKTSFSIRKFVRHMQKITEYLLTEKRRNIRLKFCVAKDIEDILIEDRERLEQVLLNLLSNSVKHTMSGSISLEINLLNKTTLQFEVKDTGCGMSLEQVNSLFKLKKQGLPQSVLSGDRITRKSAGLSGLGLTVTKMICEKMGSDIKVTSTVSKGSSFAFSITTSVNEGSADDGEIPDENALKNPCYRYNMDCKRVNTLPTKLYKKPKKSLKILIVDDNALNRFVPKNMIKKFGYEVFEAENGKEALKKLSELQNQDSKILILMDIEMPVMDGIEATIQIRKMEKLPRPHIVALTAFASEMERENCLKIGMDGFISKPLTKYELADVLSKFQFLYYSKHGHDYYIIEWRHIYQVLSILILLIELIRIYIYIYTYVNERQLYNIIGLFSIISFYTQLLWPANVRRKHVRIGSTLRGNLRNKRLKS